MSELDDRLAALDPVAAHPYAHRDLEGLITRVTSLPAGSRGRLSRVVVPRLGGLLIAGSLITASAIALVQGAAPSLAILSLPAKAAQTPTELANKAAAGPIQIYEQLDFSAGSGLGATPTTPSVRLAIPSNAESEAARVAKIFGVTGSPVNTNGDGSDWTVTSSSGSSLDYENTAVPQWHYSSSAPGVAGTTQPGTLSATATTEPTAADAAAAAMSYLAQLGYGYQLSAPSFSTSTTTTASASGTSSTTSDEDVSYTVNVDGLATDQVVDFSIGAGDVVDDASGPAFAVKTTTDYPLQSPLAGVAALNAAEQTQFSATGASANTTPAPIVDVTLDSDTVALETYQLTNGTTWLLPVYHYTGLVHASGQPPSGTWSELALDPAYVQVGSTPPGAAPGSIFY